MRKTPALRSRRFGLRNALVTLQVALSFVLLVAAGVFVRSLDNARSVDTGFAAKLAVAEEDLGDGDRLDPAGRAGVGDGCRPRGQQDLRHRRDLVRAALRPPSALRWHCAARSST